MPFGVELLQLAELHAQSFPEVRLSPVPFGVELLQLNEFCRLERVTLNVESPVPFGVELLQLHHVAGAVPDRDRQVTSAFRRGASSADTPRKS